MTAADITILLEDTKTHRDGVRGYLYQQPVEIITTSSPDEVLACLERLDQRIASGLYAAGWLAYECGYILESCLAPLMPDNQSEPLVWFALFQDRRPMWKSDIDCFWDEHRPACIPTHTVGALEQTITQPDYMDAIARIHHYLAAGDIYQANFTIRNYFDFEGDAASLYLALRVAQPVKFSAYIKTPDHTILSFSPELFISRQGKRLKAKPMKGTASRGFLLEDDLEARQILAADEKSRAENLMIVDLIRNDLSRIAIKGSVKTPKLFEIETYRSVLQMTSTVEAEILPDLPLLDILRALFPCGSVTGAPKIRAMEIIRELEDTSRGIYTGAIGHISPNRDFCFNVPIRTLKIAKKRGYLNTGGGIVADSRDQDEYQECLLKSRFLTNPYPAFDLIETMLWRPGEGIIDLNEHLARLSASARYFDFSFDPDIITRALEAHLAGLRSGSSCRIRLLVSSEGNHSITSASMQSDEIPSSPFIGLAETAVDSHNVLLYHKTTRREFYETALKKYTAKTVKTGCFDVIFINERGELTEGTRTNLFIEKAGQLWTPPVTCGLLPGIMRKRLLKTGKAKEEILTAKDLIKADRIFLCNALRGLIKVKYRQFSKP